MFRFIFVRVLSAIGVLALVCTIVFLIFFVLQPSNPAIALAGKDPQPSVVRELTREFGTNRPLTVQLGHFFSRLVLGDQYGWPGFGYSYETRAPVLGQIGRHLAVTLEVAGGAAFIAILLGIALGVLAAVKAGSLFDRVILLGSVVGASTPTFCLGLVLLLVFWQKLGVTPGTGYVPPSASLGQWAAHMLLPWITLAALLVGTYARLIRNSLIDSLQQGYSTTALSKGMSRTRLVVVHGLRPSMSGTLTVMAVDFGTLITGAVITENVFNLPGMGSWAVSSAFTGDMPVLMAVTIVAAALIMFANLLADLACLAIDPRLRTQR